MKAAPRVRLVLLAFWVLPALVATLGLWLVPSRLNPGLTLWQSLASQLLMWLAWGGWSVVIAAVGTRFPFQRGRVIRAFAAHIPLSVLVVAGQILVVNAVGLAFGISERRGLDSILAIGVRQYGDLFTVIFWAIVLVHMSVRWYVLTATLGQDLAVAQLRALQSQLNPHFLFNALNSVVTLIGKDPPLAQRTVVRLADLLRATLKAGETQEVTLQQELEVTTRYLEIEQVRFADRLAVEWAITETEPVLVPAFGLQPLVENAILHGIGPRPGPGRVVISARRDQDAVVLTVEDDGGGLSGGPGKLGGGVGLANLRARLARLYGDAGRLELAERPGGGTVVTLRVPRRLKTEPFPRLRSGQQRAVE